MKTNDSYAAQRIADVTVQWSYAAQRIADVTVCCVVVIRSAAHYRCYCVLCSGHTQRSVSQMFLCNAIWPNIVQLSYSSCTLQMIWCNAIWPNIAQFSYSDYSSSAAFVLVQFNQIFCSGHTRGLKGRIADVLMQCTTRLKKKKVAPYFVLMNKKKNHLKIFLLKWF